MRAHEKSASWRGEAKDGEERRKKERKKEERGKVSVNNSQVNTWTNKSFPWAYRNFIQTSLSEHKTFATKTLPS